MELVNDNWMRIFEIPDTSKHKSGFTIYKVVSMLYPKYCPDSVTKVTVWKRYNDFKKLHRDLKVLHKAMKMKNKFPSLPTNSYFNRFDEAVIEQRRTNILKVLEFIGINSQMFTSDICVQFFKTSYAPTEMVNSNILSIRAELNLPEDSDFNLIRQISDEDRTISDSDSVSTLGSAVDHLPDPLNPNTSVLTKRLSDSLTNSCTSLHDSLSVSALNLSLDGSMTTEGLSFPTPPQTPNSFTSCSSSYILIASQHITEATEFEKNKKYEHAFAAYKAGIDILLRNVKDEKDIDRRDMIRHKVEKYLLRAEKIYTIHLSPESKTIRNYISKPEDVVHEVVEETVSDLYKYKVIKVINSGMLVLHSENQQLYFVKVIHKTAKFSNNKLLLPGTVPYMVKLHNYYNCEHCLFLILQYCSGFKFADYVKQKLTNSEDNLNSSFYSNVLSYESGDKEDENSDYDSDYSYSDLILDYASHKLERSNSSSKSSDFNKTDKESTSDINVAISLDGVDGAAKLQNFNSSLDTYQIKKFEGKDEAKSLKSSRKSSERSEWSLFEECQMFENNLLPISDITKWTAQLLLALERLHLAGVICCDLQMDNILIDECGDLVLTYMCSVSDKYDIAFNFPSLVLAPEMYSFYPPTEAVDWWSYGAILYEMLVGMPFKYFHPEGMTAHTILKIPKYVSVEGRSLLKQLLTYEPHERLGYGNNGAEDVKFHPFFNTISWDSLSAKYTV